MKTNQFAKLQSFDFGTTEFVGDLPRVRITAEVLIEDGYILRADEEKIKAGVMDAIKGSIVYRERGDNPNMEVTK